MGISKSLKSIENYERKTEFLVDKAPEEAIDRRRKHAKEIRAKMLQRHKKNLFAEGLKLRMTRAERMLSASLEKYRKHKCYFRCQQVVCGYIADFLFPKSRLIVELDGSFHDGRESYDERRDSVLQAAGYTVIRFKNEEIYRDCDRITGEIVEMVKGMNRLLWGK